MAKNDLEDRFNMEVGKRITDVQEALGLSDNALAGKADMTARDLVIYKDGGRSMRTMRLRNLAKALGVSTDYLLGMKV